MDKQTKEHIRMAVRPDIFDLMTDFQILQRYRMNRDGINQLEGLIGVQIAPQTARHHSLSAREKILITLRYLASGVFQINDGDLHHVAQSTVSKSVTEVVNCLSSQEVILQFIRFPMDAAALNDQVREFAGIANFPKVVGAIDCTHVKILAPSLEEEIYVYRKGFHSINVQVIFNTFDIICDVVARWPGSSHDSRILHNSGIRQLFERGLVPPGYHLLGDSGYPCRRWLLTPYINPQPGSQTNYNRSHKITRSKVERGIGQMKRRFGILHGEIRMKPEKACRVITSCAVLHNYCKQIPLPEVVNDNNEDQPDINNNQDASQIGLRYRDYFANNYF